MQIIVDMDGNAHNAHYFRSIYKAQNANDNTLYSVQAHRGDTPLEPLYWTHDEAQRDEIFCAVVKDLAAGVPLINLYDPPDPDADDPLLHPGNAAEAPHES